MLSQSLVANTRAHYRLLIGPHQTRGRWGGLAGALLYAAHRYDQVLSVSIDAPLLPTDLLTVLEPAPSYLALQPVIGLWPVSAIDTIQTILRGNGKQSMQSLAFDVGARLIEGIDRIPNVNTRDDLKDLRRLLCE